MAAPATKTFRFLTLSQINRLHGVYINPNAQPTQPNLLQSAVDSPMNIKHYEKQDNLFQLAASLSEKIMKNHAYQDGNKRTALVAADMFLKINGYELHKVPLKEYKNNQVLVRAHVAVCTNTCTAEQLGAYYQSLATAIEAWTPEILGVTEQ